MSFKTQNKQRGRTLRVTSTRTVHLQLVEACKRSSRLCAVVTLRAARHDFINISCAMQAVGTLHSSLARQLRDTPAGGIEGSQMQPSPAPVTAKRWGKNRPFLGTVLAIEGLCTVRGADDRDTVRVEIELGKSGLAYSPGDALGIYPRNCPEVRFESPLIPV